MQSLGSFFDAVWDTGRVLQEFCWLINLVLNMHGHGHHAPELFGVLSFLGFGLLTGLHCIGMCGPLSSIMVGVDKAKAWPRLAAYHGFRVLSYALIGFSLNALPINFNGKAPFPILFWVVVALLAAYVLGVRIPSPPFVMRAQSWLLAKVKTPRLMLRSVILGFFSPLLPCGILYAVFAASLAAPSAWHGALWMGVFAMGTVPLLLGAQLGIRMLGNNVFPKARAVILKLSAAGTLFFFIYMKLLR